MITGEIKSRVDEIWNAMWTGGLSNPQTVMEQLTLLLFPKGLDDAQTLAERQARARNTALERDLFPDQLDGIAILDDEGNKIAEGRAYADLRCSQRGSCRARCHRRRRSWPSLMSTWGKTVSKDRIMRCAVR